jgi:cytochrome b
MKATANLCIRSVTPSHTPSQTTQHAASVRVWDLPTRLFHWLLLACVIGLFATAYAPGSWIDWHARLGYAMLTLLLFRLVWGVIGGHWSRFIHFVPRSGSSVSLGHTLSGALAVAAMLLALITQVATGLVGDDEIAFTGPLNRFIATDLGLAATAWHKGVGQWLLVGLIALHVSAIAFYLFVRRNNLVGPMVHGDKPLPDGAQASLAAPVSSRDTAGSRLLALGVLGGCAGAVALMVRLAG